MNYENPHYFSYTIRYWRNCKSGSKPSKIFEKKIIPNHATYEFYLKYWIDFVNDNVEMNHKHDIRIQIVEVDEY